ncbi:PQQ-binding-like beta-propeller repeat protein, partial [Streptomyces sp. SID5785]|uniref:outer membrane protein assembly factor BamB family protein n=1 Tax=Streptomyces sp. SID5785 TaxID=2690309 RepID=UPI001360C91B
DPSGAGQAPPSRGASASPGAARPGGVVMAYGGADHSGEFGADALDAGALPRGWAPWAVPYPKDLVRRGAGCALASGTVVCRDARGGAAAVAAASGKQLWAVSGSGATPAAGARQPAPVTDGRSVFVTGPSGLRALRLGTGKEAWSTHGSGGTVLAVAYAAGTVYTVERTGSSGRALAVRARAADDGARTWSTSVEGEAGRTPGFAVSGGRVYVASSGSVAALSAQDGSVRARRTTPGCTGLLARSGAVLCWSERSAGVRELDGGTLAVRRVHGDLTPSVPPVAGSAGVLVVAGADVMEAYDLASGKRRWRLETADSAAPRVLALAGSKVLWVDEIYLKTMDLSGDAATRRTRSLPSDGSGLGGALGEPVLLSGTAIFAADGRRMVSTTQP